MSTRADRLEDKETIFTRLADKVSFGMGTPQNIAFWIVAVIVWIGLFAVGIMSANTSVLPGWFTSNAFNFPLNTVTTLAELYIGFLVAAAANRSERNLRTVIQGAVDDEKLDLKNEDMIKVLLQRIDVDHLSPMRDSIARIEKAVSRA